MISLQETRDFFGVDTGRINVIITRVAMREEGPPEWMRGRPTLVDLPRFAGGVLENVVPVSRDRAISLLPEQLVWIVETLQMDWSLTAEGWSFECPKEALYFKMAF